MAAAATVTTTASAQSSFWAITALVVNSAVQPAGKICGLSPSPLNRLSPVLQVLNALHIVYRVALESAQHGWNIRKAAGTVAREKHIYDLTFTSTPPMAPERIWWFRAVVFFLGALPQAVKILAIRGDAVSRVLALSYAVPFVVIELVEWLGESSLNEPGSGEEPEDLWIVTDDAATLRLTTFANYVSVCVELMNLLSIKYLFGNAVQVNFHNFVILLPVAAWAFLALSALLTGGIGDQYGEFSLVYRLLLPLSMLVFYGSMASWQHPELRGRGLGIFIGPVLFIVASVVQFVVYQLLRLLRLVRRIQKNEDLGFETWFGSWSMVWILVYYGCLYDASTTYKPAWTDWLG